MEEKRNFQAHNEQEKREGNGQRISVRPGNFAPPKAVSTETKGGNGGQEARGDRPRTDGNSGGGSNHHRNRNRHRGGHKNHHQNQQKHTDGAQNARPQPNQGQGKPQPNQGQSRPQPNQNEGRPQARQDSRNNRDQGKGRHPGGRRDERGVGRREEKGQVLSASLQRELDEEFSTPTLSSSLPSYRERVKESVVDTEEFTVDIATAAYLTEDIPCGFPIPDGKAVEVIGVRFRHAGKIYFFAPGNEKFRVGDAVLVDTARGPELGEVVMLNRKIAEKDIVQPLRAVLRRATEKDIAHQAENQEKEAEALRLCAEKIAAHKLDMRLVEAQYTFDNSKLLFYFTSEGRVDFRDLVRDLAGAFRTRIELRQIGIRDESRLIGGLGMCGRPFCCTSFLNDFGQISIKMAKEQGLSINTSKISGCCGRLMCCLRYEHETYQMEARLTPSKDSVVDTPSGRGVVVESTPLAGLLKVRLDASPDEQPAVFHRDDVTVISGRKGKGAKPHESAVDETELAEAELAQEDAVLPKETANEE